MKVNQSTPCKKNAPCKSAPCKIDQNLITPRVISNTLRVCNFYNSGNFRIQVLGIIEAGFASPVDEELADILHIEDYLIRDKDASFMLRVEDDSLQHLGICENDLVIFERGADTKIGDLAVVLGTDGYHLQHLSRITSGQVVGLVVSIIRKYK